MAGGSDSTTTNSSNALPSWVTPYAQNYLQRASEVADLPYQQYSGQRTAGINQQQAGAMTAIQNRAMYGSPVMNAANQTMQATAGGQYLNGNPYLQSQIDATSQDVLRNYNMAVRPQQQAQEAQSGSFGNTGLQQMQTEQQRQLAQTLGNVSSGMRMQNYTSERGNQMQALGMAPTYAANDYTDAQQLMNVGNQIQGQEQKGMDTQYQDWQAAQQYPRQQLQLMGNAMGLNFGNNGQQVTTGPQGNGVAQGLGALLAAYGAYKAGG